MFSNTPSASQCPHLPVYWNGARVGAWHVAPRMRHPCHFGLTIESQPTALLPTVGHSALKSSSHCGAQGQDKPHFAAISFKTPSYFSTESATPKSYTKMISELKRKRQAATQSLLSAAQSKYHWPQPATPATHRQEAELTCQNMANAEPAGNSQNHVCNSCPQPSPLCPQNNQTKQATATAWPRPATAHTDD